MELTRADLIFEAKLKPLATITIRDIKRSLEELHRAEKIVVHDGDQAILKDRYNSNVPRLQITVKLCA